MKKPEFKVIRIIIDPRHDDFGHGYLLEELYDGWLVVWATHMGKNIFYVLGRYNEVGTKT